MRGHGSASDLQHFGRTIPRRKHHNLIVFMRRRDPGPDPRALPHKPGSAGQVINDKSPVWRKVPAGLVSCEAAPTSMRTAAFVDAENFSTSGATRLVPISVAI